MSRSSPKVSSGEFRPGSIAAAVAAACAAAAHRPVLDDRRQAIHRRLQRRIQRRLAAQVVERGLQTLNLAGERLGGAAVVGQLEFERGVRREQVVDVGPGLPRRAHADEHRQSDHQRHDGEGGPQADREPADDTGLPIGDEDCVAA